MIYNRDSNFKKKMDDNKRMRISYGKIEKVASEERELKKLNDTRNFSRDLYDQGTAWYDSGLPLDAAPANLRMSKLFVNGYNHGSRLSLARDLQQNNRNR